MAISVDTTYKTVLSILNKESRGFLTPDEFNKIGSQVQLDILEKNFYEYNRAVVKSNLNRSVSEYGDIPSNIKEKIDILSKEQEVYIPNVNSFIPNTNLRPVESIIGVSVPTSITPGTYSNIAATTTGAGTGLTVTVVAPGNDFGGGTTVKVVNGGTGYLAGDSITVPQASMTGASGSFTFPALSSHLNIAGNLILPTDIYKVIALSRLNRTINFDELKKSEFTYVNSSKLTAPSLTYPVYYRDSTSIKVNPSTLIDSYLTLDYVKTPADPAWIGTEDSNGALTYSAGSSVDFELHISDKVSLILGILKYAGVVISDPQVVQAASAEANSQVQLENL
jgi:hypothetical protein